MKAATPGRFSLFETAAVCKQPRHQCHAEGRLAQGEAEPREKVQVGTDRRTDQREERPHRLAVQRAEVDGLLQEAERHHRPGNVHDDGVAHVRNGNAVADAGRAQRFPREEDVQQEVAIQQLVADAALTGSRDAALQALLVDPVVGSSRAAEAILADFEDAHGDLWPTLA